MTTIRTPASVFSQLSQMSSDQIDGIGRELWFLERLGYEPFLYDYRFMDGEFIGIGIIHKDEETDKIIDAIKKDNLLDFVTRGVHVRWYEHVHLQEMGDDNPSRLLDKLKKIEQAIDELRAEVKQTMV